MAIMEIAPSKDMVGELERQIRKLKSSLNLARNSSVANPCQWVMLVFQMEYNLGILLLETVSLVYGIYKQVKA